MSPKKVKRGGRKRSQRKVRDDSGAAKAPSTVTPEGKGPLDFVHDIAKALTSTLQIDQVLKTIMEKVNDLMSPDTWSLLLVDSNTRELYFQVATGAGADKLKDVRLKMGEGIAGWVAQTGEAAIVPDVRKDPRFAGHVDELTNMLTNSIICVPIRTKERVLGVIEIVNYVGKRDFETEDVALLQAMADYAAIALENAMHVQRIHELTITDDVTSLYNARHLNFVLETEIYRSNRYHYEFSLIFIDLDHFKEVNDTYGHLAGSKLLRELADVIRGGLRMIDHAFRYGGDEFVVLLPQTSKEAATVVARRLRARVNETTFLQEEDLNLKITASLGMATFPADATTKAEMIRLADEAMYLVKNTSRNNIAVANQGLIA